jgi:hypothetical protein
VNGWEIIRHTVAIYGRVIDSQTSKGIGGARVRITDGPPEFMDTLPYQAKAYGRRWESLRDRPDRKHAEPDGHFHFLDLQEGSYTMTALAPGSGSRYGTAQVITAVALDSLGDPVPTNADINLPPTTITGRITDQSNGDPVFMAQLHVKGSDETTYCDNQGDYRLVGLEVGSREIQVSAQGYHTISETVILNAAGTFVTRNIALTGNITPVPLSP